MPTPPTPPTYWWLTVRIDACRTQDERVAAASGDDAVRMWRELHPNLEVIHVRPVPELVDIELEHMSTNNNNNTDPIRGVPPLLAARAALVEPERVAPKSIEERIAEADAAIEASMKRIRKIIATPARQLAAEANRSAVPVATPAGPTDEEIIAFWSEHCAGDGDAGIIRLARWGNQPAPPAVPEGREPASVVSEPSDEELLELMPEGFTAPVCAAAAIQANVLSFARAVLARWGHHPAPPAAGEVGEMPTYDDLSELCSKHGLDVDGWPLEKFDALWEVARAVLARFGNHSPDARKMVGPAEGDVAELVAWLRGANWDSKRQTLATRTADLLEQRHPAPVPVPVSERLPGPEDCDAEGRCWWWYPPVPEQNYGYWIYEDNAVPERSRLEWPDSWLPANALPLPQGEVK